MNFVGKISQAYNSFNSIWSPSVDIKRPIIAHAYFAKKSLTKEKTNTSCGTHPYSFRYKNTITDKNKTRIAKIILKRANEAEKDKNKYTTLEEVKKALDNKTYLPKSTINVVLFEIKEKAHFEMLNSASLEDEVYLIVETQYFRDKEIRINIRQGKEKVIAEKDKLIEVMQNGKVTMITCKVGEWAKNEDIVNEDDFLNCAITKLKLRPESDESLEKWKEAIKKTKDKKTYLYLLVDAHSGNADYDSATIIYCGRNPGEDSIRNYWLDMEGNWFELMQNKRAPWMKIAYKELGVEEIAGKEHNPRILAYHKSAGLGDYKNKKGQTVKITDDKNWPWCSSFVTWVFKQTKDYSGKITAKATNWKDWGQANPKNKPMYGALAVIDWGANDNGAGHVGFVVSADDKHYYLLGGNQTGGDKTTNGKVCIGKYNKSVIDYVRIPKNYTPSESDYEYDEIKSTDSGFESYSTTR